MKKEEKRAFEYGRAAAESACQFAVCYDPCMRKLVSETRTEAGHRRNQENMRAWYMGYLTQTASSGQGIPPEMFIGALSIFVDCESAATLTWIRFASECVDAEQYVDLAPEEDRAVAINRWLESLLAGLLGTQKQYGTRIAKQVCDLALQPNCLYPSEMLQAAEHFQKGGSSEDITEMIANDDLEGDQPFFPKLTDGIKEGHSPNADMDRPILGM